MCTLESCANGNEILKYILPLQVQSQSKKKKLNNDGEMTAQQVNEVHDLVIFIPSYVLKNECNDFSDAILSISDKYLLSKI